MAVVKTSIEFVDLNLDPGGTVKYACLDPQQLYREATRLGASVEHWHGKANSFHCPRGKVAGRAYVLLPRKEVLGRRENAGDTGLDFTATYAIEFTHGSTTLTISELYVIGARELYADGQDTSDQTPMLLELADKRDLMGMSSCNVWYNSLCPGAPADADAAGDFSTDTDLYYAESLNGGAFWTWQTMCGDLWGDLPSGLSPGVSPTLPYAPDDYPRNLRFVGISPWDAYHEVLAKLGCVLLYNPLTGAFTIVRTNAAQNVASITTDTDLLAHHGSHKGVVDYPATIRVFFPRRMEHQGSEKEIQRVAGNWIDNETYSKDIASGLTGAVTGTVHSIIDDMPAVYKFDATALNTTACDTRAAEVAANYKNQLLYDLGEYRSLFRGLKSAVLPGASIAEIRWYDTGSGMVTEYLGAATAQPEPGDGPSLAKEPWLPPDLQRPGFPDYPRLVHMVECDNSTVDAGCYEGKVVRLDPEQALGSASFTNGADCWIYPIEGQSVSSGDRFLGRLVGTANIGADIRPLFVVGSRGSETIKFAVYQSGTNGDAQVPRTFSVKTSWHDGSHITGDAFDVVTHVRWALDTSLFAGDVVGYVLHPESADPPTKVIVTDCWDDKFGTVKAWDELGGVSPPNGWEDFTSARGRYLRGWDQADDAGFGQVTVGGTGGTLAHHHCCHSMTEFTYSTGGSSLWAHTNSSLEHEDASHMDPWLGIRFIKRTS